MVVGAVVDVVVEGADGLVSLIGNGDACVVREGHGEKAVEAFDAADREHLRLPAVIFAEAEAEEIADGGFDAGVLLAVPVDAEDDALEVIGLAVSDGEPDVRDLTGTICVEHGFCGAGVDVAEVGVGALGVGAGRAMEDVGLLHGEVRLPAGRLRVCTKGECAQG